MIINLFDETGKLSDDLKKIIEDTARESIIASPIKSCQKDLRDILVQGKEVSTRSTRGATRGDNAICQNNRKDLAKVNRGGNLGECDISGRCSVDILIVDLENMQDINRDKRGIDAPTDVLSFPAGESQISAGIRFLGDIVIAYEKIFSQAEEYGHSAEREIGFLTTHAMLHLMGYNHDTPERESEMFEKQESILSGLGLKR